MRFRMVTSAYGTHGHMQEYERGVICSSTWAWGLETHEVYGGIGYTYRQMGACTSWLGLPLSGELWLSEKERIRRSYFEGGYTDWELGRDKPLRMCRYPHPYIKNVEIQPRQVCVGDPITIRIEATNSGDMGEEGYLTLAFPDVADDIPSVTSDINCYVSRPGEQTYGGYGAKVDIALQHYRAEAACRPWKSGESHWLEVVTHASTPGPFRVFARVTAGNGSFDKLYPIGSEHAIRSGSASYE